MDCVLSGSKKAGTIYSAEKTVPLSQVLYFLYSRTSPSIIFLQNEQCFLLMNEINGIFLYIVTEVIINSAIPFMCALFMFLTGIP